MSTSSAPFDVCVVGSANLDLVATSPRLPRPGETVLGTSYAEHPGGKGLNQAVAAAAPAPARRSSPPSATTMPAAAARRRDRRRRRRRRSSPRSPIPTGRAVITVDDRGENSIVVVPGANAHVDGPRSRRRRASCSPSSRSRATPSSRRSRLARRQGAVDRPQPGARRALDAELLELVDVLVPNEHELAALDPPER